MNLWIWSPKYRDKWTLAARVQGELRFTIFQSFHYSDTHFTQSGAALILVLPLQPAVMTRLVHCGPDLRRVPVSSLSLSLGQREASSCYTTVNNTINSPWLINWLQTKPAALLCTLLCVTSLSYLSSSRYHVQTRCGSLNGENTRKNSRLAFASPGRADDSAVCSAVRCRNPVWWLHQEASPASQYGSDFYTARRLVPLKTNETRQTPALLGSLWNVLHGCFWWN